MLEPSAVSSAVSRSEELTFKGNLAHTRFGWLRLTPAYSIRLVEQLLACSCGPETTVLDTFCGTGTTALVCAERGIHCDTTDINRFLLWLTGLKTAPYTPHALNAFSEFSTTIAKTAEIDN